jgi:hypothetical protein
MELTNKQKEIIVSELGSWLPPKKIKEEFGINTATLYYYSNKNRIAKYRQNMAEEKLAYTREWNELINDIQTSKLNKVRQLLNDYK